MSRDLVIIESPGKLRTLHKLFAQVGLHADICATIGHFLENPPDLRDLSIKRVDEQYVELRREPHRHDSFVYLRDQLRKCHGRIIVATDNDQEGHVIAQDVSNLIRAMGIKQSVFRMLFPALDQDSVRVALDRLSLIDPTAAKPGSARRILDRILSGTLSDFDAGLPVGRVQTALLGMSESGLSTQFVHAKMPAADGGAPFAGRIPVPHGVTPADLIAELGVHALPLAPVQESAMASLDLPWNYGDAVVGLNRSLGVAIGQAADILQQLYEQGAISYPRTATRAFTSAGAEAIERLASIKGILSFKKDMVPLLPIDSDTPHEGIRVLNINDAMLAKLDLGKPPRLHLSSGAAAFSLIARKGIEAGIPVRRDTPNLQHAPEWTHNIEWHRDVRRCILPWRTPNPSVVETVAPQSILVSSMMSAGVGRPSTWVAHAEKLVSRGLVDESLALTEKGEKLLEQAPSSLARVDVAAELETLLDRQGRSIEQLVDAGLSVALGGDEMLLAQVRDCLESTDYEDQEEDKLEERYQMAP